MSIPAVKDFQVSHLVAALNNQGYEASEDDFNRVMYIGKKEHQFVFAVSFKDEGGDYGISCLFVSLNDAGAFVADWSSMPVAVSMTDDEVEAFFDGIELQARYKL